MFEFHEKVEQTKVMIEEADVPLSGIAIKLLYTLESLADKVEHLDSSTSERPDYLDRILDITQILAEAVAKGMAYPHYNIKMGDK